MDLVARTRITDIVAARNAAMAQMNEAAALIEAGHALAHKASDTARGAHHGFSFYESGTQRAVEGLFKAFDKGGSLKAYREQLDASIWVYVLEAMGLGKLMDKVAREEFHKQLSENVPVFTEEAAYEAFRHLMGDAELIFQRGLARAFMGLDRRFRSHDGFKLGSRVILTNMFDDKGYWNYHTRMVDTLSDIERVFAVFDGKDPAPSQLRQAISADREGAPWGPKQSSTVTPFFKINVFKNGNAHLWFTRPDLVERANKALAAYYGEVLPDAVPAPDTVGLASRTGALSKDLQFYPTPSAVTERALRNTHFPEGCRVLEPSAGVGGIVNHLIKTNAGHITAVEVDSGRASQITHDSRVEVRCANFLGMTATPSYDVVVMNPPFYGTHWMQHVVHAFDFLKDGGQLIAILPISADLGMSKKHKAFRAWAKKHSRGYGLFLDLPAESFAESGTRVNTLVLKIRK